MHHARLATITGLLFLFAFSMSAPSADAATVQKVKGNVAIVAFDPADGSPAVGDKFFAMENGKKKAILQIVQIKNGRAKVKVAKGKAAEGMTVTAAGKSKGATASADGETPADPDAAAADAAEQTTTGKKKVRSAGGATVFRDMTLGLVGGYSMDSQSVTIAGTTAQAMTGSGFSAKGFVDIPVTGSLGLLTRIGAEQFNVQSSSFKTEIMYACVDLMLKYSFSDGTFVPFAMGGLGLHFPISKTSNILDINRISSTTVFYGGGGFNWLMGGSTYIQMTAEYGMFPPSNDVATTFIAARAGLGFRF